jgi:hypothetical protein
MKRAAPLAVIVGMAPPLLAVMAGLAAADEMGLLGTFASPIEQLGGLFGAPVSALGDVNGDGCADFVVSAVCETQYASPNDAGRVHVISGSDGTSLLVLASPNEQEDGHLGVSVCGIGDVNGDGCADVVAGTPWEHPGSSPDYAGRAYVFSGATGVPLHELQSPYEEWAGNFGVTISGTDDVDGDGYADVVVGAPGENPGPLPENAGMAHLYSGATGTRLRSFRSPHVEYGAAFGYAVSDAGDIDGDGKGDVVIGAPYEDASPAVWDVGRVYVLSGATGDLIHRLSSPNVQEDELFGASVARLGDVDGDDHDDFVIGAPFANVGEGRDAAGAAYVFNGAAGTAIHTLLSPNPEYEGEFGLTVAGAGDLDGDGCPDVLVGAPWEDPGMSPEDAGRAYAFSGATGGLLCTLQSPNEEVDGHLGFSLASVGDISGDGLQDVIVGAYAEDPGLAPGGAGRVYAYTPAFLLWGTVAGGQLALSWTPIVPAAAYWVYGAGNEAHFLPDLTAPYQHRLAILSPGWSSWSIGNCIGDPNSNWTYLLVAVDNAGQELERSNRIAEFDFGLNCVP